MPKLFTFFICVRPSEPARIQPVEDGREEEAERSGDAGAQGSSRNQREPRQRLFPLAEITRTHDFQKEGLKGSVLLRRRAATRTDVLVWCISNVSVV